MTAFKKAYGVAATALVAAVCVGMFSSERPLMLLALMLISACTGIAGQFGLPKTRQWVEDNF